jgi:light-regulated signal transduction histidine kinase (bacteriophytochrome)
MNHDDELVGILLFGLYQPGTLNDEQIRYAQQVAAQLSVALRQATLYEQVQEYAEDLERKVEDRTLKLQEKADEMEAFTYSVSHDLRAPLRAINGFADLLMEAYTDELSEHARHYLNRIHSNSLRMGQLIDDLLMLSRVGRKELVKQPVNIAALVRKVVAELEADGQLEKAEIVIADLPACEADSTLLKQVYFNLITNAIKYSREQDTPTVTIGYSTHNNQTTYFVQDNGIGFDMQYADKLFGVFQRLHSGQTYEGTGIGLATVRRIINRHGGQVWANAAVNQGATFYFTLCDPEQETV